MVIYIGGSRGFAEFRRTPIEPHVTVYDAKLTKSCFASSQRAVIVAYFAPRPSEEPLPSPVSAHGLFGLPCRSYCCHLILFPPLTLS